MSTNAPAGPSQGNAPKPRSPVERLVVWGGIGVLVALVAVEFTARASYTSAVSEVLQKVKEADESDKPLKRADVKQLVGGKDPVSTEDVSGMNLHNAPKKVEKYTWWSLNPNANRVLLVYYGHGDDPDVLSAATQEEQSADEKYKAKVGDAAQSPEGQSMDEAAAAGEGPMPGAVAPPGAGAKPDEPKTEEEPKKDEEPKADEDAKPKAEEKAE
jgi:hypothetical protein